MEDRKNENVYADLTQKIMTDAEFRVEMRRDAKTCIEKFLGKPLPKKYTIKVIEPDPEYSFTILLLPREDVLSDKVLDAAAGGVSNCISSTIFSPGFNLANHFKGRCGSNDPSSGAGHLDRVWNHQMD